MFLSSCEPKRVIHSSRPDASFLAFYSVRQISFFFMRVVGIALTVFALCTTSSSVFAGTSEQSSFLRPAASTEIPLPVEKRIGSTFFAMDVTRFEALANWREFICTIPNVEVPGMGTYTLRVEQFDDVDGATIGEYAVPKHAFFRGSLDGVKESARLLHLLLR